MSCANLVARSGLDRIWTTIGRSGQIRPGRPLGGRGIGFPFPGGQGLLVIIFIVFPQTDCCSSDLTACAGPAGIVPASLARLYSPPPPRPRSLSRTNS